MFCFLATMATAVSDDIGVEDKEGTLKEFCSPMYTKNVATRPIAAETTTFLSIITCLILTYIVRVLLKLIPILVLALKIPADTKQNVIVKIKNTIEKL
jgi:hypothetical protein